jgi:NAD(P)H-nitrite reductase large subunit
MEPKKSETHKTFVVLPNMDMGFITPDDLETIAALCRKFDVPATRVTGAQRLSLMGVSPEMLQELRRELDIPDKPPHARNRVHYVQACPGLNWCRYAIGDSRGVGDAIQRMELDMPLPSKIKVGVSGCRMCCCESWVRDVGLVAQRGGWRFIFGGNAAGRPRIGDVVAEELNDEQAVALVKKCLTFYCINARFKTRSARFMERFGLEQLKKGLFSENAEVNHAMPRSGQPLLER